MSKKAIKYTIETEGTVPSDLVFGEYVRTVNETIESRPDSPAQQKLTLSQNRRTISSQKWASKGHLYTKYLLMNW